jgi:serine/threonine-protein kinase RsbW
MSLEAEPSAIGVFRRALAAFAAEAGASPGTVDDVALSVSEAVTNAVRHAYDDGRIPGEVRAEAFVERGDEHAVLIVSVSDDGPGIRPRSDSPGLGLGLSLIRRLATSMTIVTDAPGATISMCFRLP